MVLTKPKLDNRRPMKIAIAVNGRPHAGGVTTYINTIADTLCEQGCNIRVVTPFEVSARRRIHNRLQSSSDALLFQKPLIGQMDAPSVLVDGRANTTERIDTNVD